MREKNASAVVPKLDTYKPSVQSLLGKVKLKLSVVDYFRAQGVRYAKKK